MRRQSFAPTSTDALIAVISTLVAERQELRNRGAGAAKLEKNRVSIARAQWELSYALIRRHIPDVQRVAA